METILNFKGINSIKIGERIELPPIIELFRVPGYNMADASDVYKYGDELTRKLLSQTPLRNTKKYVTVYTMFQYLYPNVIPVPSSDWHCDGVSSPYFSNDIFHTMMNDTSTCFTQFLNKDVNVDTQNVDVGKMNHMEFRKYINSNSIEFGFEPTNVEPNKMYSWTCRHPHRAQFPTKKEFRFFWKVCESDYHVPHTYDKAYRKSSVVFVGNDGPSILNIEQGERGIIIKDRTI